VVALLLACAPPPVGTVENPNSVHIPGVDGVRCTLRSDPAEVHVAPVEDGEASLHGLLADELYDCDADGVLFEVHTEPLPDWVPPVTLTGDPGSSRNTYALFQHFVQDPGQGLTSQALFIVDRHGHIRWYHRLPPEIGVTEATWLGDGRVLYGGRNALPAIVALTGEKLWEGTNTGLHHDIQMLPSGHVAQLLYRQYSDYLGFEVEVVDPDTSEVIWELASSELDLEVPQKGSNDVFHANAMVVEERHGELVKVWVNLKQTSQLIRIDPRERAIDLAVGQDTDWTIDGDWWEGAHDPQIDGDRVLVYDNGTEERGTRIQEVELDEDALTARTTWTWVPGWYEPVWGGVVYLDEGHVLVTRGHCRSCTETGQSGLIEVSPEGEIVWQVELEPLAGMYRAQALDGCDIFHNQYYCPDD